ncbi:MAG: TetR/AcrR family transcriptional regulator [Woeseiaceae bacterium]|nr:TetR/AcrR family transcriptional regulator [Woeseiaceae bacterium]
MVRNRAFDPAVALGQVVDLFATKGYADTSMDDIVRATGVSRYGLYGTFGNKRELFEQALERYADDMGRNSFLRLLEPDAGLADIRRIFDEQLDGLCCEATPHGCLLCHTALEIAPNDEEIRDVLLRFLQRMSRTFTVGLENARDKGEIRDDLDLKAAGELLTSSLFGVIVMARAGYPRKTLNAIVDTAIAGVAR